MKKFLLLIIGIFLGICPPSWAASSRIASESEIAVATPDPVEVSLLTCAAGEEIYTLFGHTAIRYKDLTQGIDIVFNYGMFSFNTPNFVLRFALGETDYMLGATDYRRFAAEYQFTDREVWQQTLNLTPLEKKQIWNALVENYLPENRTYRYNFFYDNCATRPRDRIEACLDGQLQYNEQADSAATDLTWRDLLHQYTEGHPWSRFGIDLCIGSAADRPISFRERMFVPFFLQKDFRHALVINPKGESRPLVQTETKIVSCTPEETAKASTPTPLTVMLLLLIAVAASTGFAVRHGYSYWLLDAILFAAAGIAGCIIAFLVFFSQHPAVSPNWILVVLHPLHFLCLPCTLIRVKKKAFSWYMTANFAVLTLFILLWPIIPQNIPLAVLPLALCLLIRSASNLWLQRKNSRG